MPRKRIVERAGRTGAAPEKLLLAGKINRNQPRGENYPRFQAAAALLRSRGETVIDPSDEARAWPNAVGYEAHIDHSLSLMRGAAAVVVLPQGLDGRLATLLVEYALMVGKPVLLLSARGAVTELHGHPQPLWTARLMHRGEGKDIL